MDIAAAPDLESASLQALEILQDVVPTESAAVLLVDSDRNALRFSAATGPYAERARTLLVPRSALPPIADRRLYDFHADASSPAER